MGQRRVVGIDRLDSQCLLRKREIVVCLSIRIKQRISN
jgi:hypothetical protein